MPNLDMLKNEGVLALNKPKLPQKEKTVIVLGLARGGTSMVASVLQALGVPMGTKLSPVLEDAALSQAVESRNHKLLSDIVNKRNAAHKVWGWKRPAAFKFSDVWQGRFRNPHIIAIFRDPFAIANRNRISMLLDVFQGMDDSVQQLGKLIETLKQQDCPVLLCSYEKVLCSPGDYVSSVDDFLGLNVKESWGSAIQAINPGSKDYLEASRITHSLGFLDSVDENSCKGWAFYPMQPERVVKVRVFINNEFVCSEVAKMPRPALKTSGKHPTGNCGFRIEWPSSHRPHSGDLVDVWVEGDTKSLTNSPKKV